jgi:hypothetical protein
MRVYRIDGGKSRCFYEQEIFLRRSKAEEIYAKIPSYSLKNVRKISHYLLISY